jgi:hypothetical protein
MESSLYDLVEGAGVEIHESDPSFREHQNDALWNRRAFSNRKSESDPPDELNRHTDKTGRWTNNWKTVMFGRLKSEISSGLFLALARLLNEETRLKIFFRA